MLPFNMGMGGGAVDTGDIPASLRFRGAQHLSRTFGTPTDNKRSTFSVWAKKAVNGAGATQYLFSANTAPTYTNVGIYSSTDTLGFYNSVSSTNSGNRTTTEVHRDVTGWNHYLVVFDTPNATAEDRMQLWKNGVRITAFSANTAIAQNANPQINAATFHHIGAFAGGEFWNGYMARICFVDGQALTPSSFGYLNTEINEWVSKSQSAVKAVVDAGGTNSFMLDFHDATSLTTLGYDKSSKGNNWTLNNFSLTAGATYDHMLDVPGNSFATLNPLFPTTNTLSNGNLRGALAASSNAGYGIRSTIPMVSGKYEAEFVPAASADTWSYVGVCPASFGISDVSIVGSNAVLYRAGNGNKNVNGTATAYGASWTTEAIRVAVDMDARTVTFYKAGASQGSISLPSGTENYIFVMANGNATTFTADANFGQQPITLDSGYKALCQRNLPDPAILNPEKHFDVVTRTGTAATYSVAGLGFQPDLVWVKSRGRAVDHALYDSVRGVQKQLESNQTGAETTESTGLTAFNSGGYTGGALDQINGTTATNSFVDWLWKAGGAAVTNNAGSISSQVSANVEAGFSIVTYTGTGANATVGHGLGVAPKLVIVKQRNGSTYSWTVHHDALSAGQVLFLEATAAATARATSFNSTDPSSTVFSLGTDLGTNASGNTYVAYCFAEIPGFSKIFSYTGNGSADGPFVHCGFKPKFILLKNASTTAHWIVLDTVRNTYNIVDNKLAPSSSSYENDPSPVGGAGTNMVDVLSNGFKLRHTDTPTNGNTYTYIGIAFADVAGKYSLGR